MTRIAFSRRSHRSYGVVHAAAIGSLLASLLSGCGPGAATPVPEPPALQGDKISIPSGVMIVANFGVTVVGAAGAAAPHATILVTDLDATTAPIASTVGDDGGFQITLPNVGDHEQRLVAVVDGVRSLPFDFKVAMSSIVPTSRPACLAVTPSLLVSVRGGDTVNFTFKNSCAGVVAVHTPRSRLGDPSVSFDAQFTASVPNGESQAFSVNVGANVSATLDEVVFVDVDVNGQTVRYPLGVYATGG